MGAPGIYLDVPQVLSLHRSQGWLGQGSDFSPASSCGQLTGTDGFPEQLEVEATHCEQAEIVAAVAGPMPLYPSCNNRASMGDLGSTLQTLLFAAHTTFLPLQAESMSQSQSSPQVGPPKPEYPTQPLCTPAKAYLGRRSAVMGTDPLCWSPSLLPAASLLVLSPLSL